MHETGYYSASVCGNELTGSNGYIIIVSYLSSDPVVALYHQVDIWDPQTASFEGEYLIVQTGDNNIKTFYVDLLATNMIVLIDQA